MKLFFGLLLSVLIILPFAESKAQLNKAEYKIFKKSQRKFKREKYDKAIALFEPVVRAHIEDERLWNVLIDYYRADHYANPPLSLNVRVEGGTTSESLALAELLNGVLLASQDKYFKIMKEATLYCRGLNNASVALRVKYIDVLYPTDEKVSSAAIEKYNKAESYFIKGDYNNAIKYYTQALAVNKKFYKAKLYLADSYFMKKEYDKAAPIFKELALEYPYLMEPQKYYLDALMGLDNLENAYGACVDALMLYPNEDLFGRMEMLSEELKRDFNRHWISRPCAINQAGIDINKIDDKAWKYYQEAKALIEPYCDSLGVVVKENELTKYKYMEAYCWQYMLSKSNNIEFDFAKAMHEKGFLDCYILICENHVDLYDQYHHLMVSDVQRVRKFITNQLK